MKRLWKWYFQTLVLLEDEPRVIKKETSLRSTFGIVRDFTFSSCTFVSPTLRGCWKCYYRSGSCLSWTRTGDNIRGTRVFPRSYYYAGPSYLMRFATPFLINWTWGYRDASLAVEPVTPPPLPPNFSPPELYWFMAPSIALFRSRFPAFEIITKCQRMIFSGSHGFLKQRSNLFRKD